MKEFVAHYWLEALFGIILTVLTGLVNKYRKIVAQFKKEHDGLKDGVEALIKDRIIQIYEKAMSDGYCPSYMKVNIQGLIEKLNNISFEEDKDKMIDSMVREVYRLPNQCLKKGGVKDGESQTR